MLDGSLLNAFDAVMSGYCQPFPSSLGRKRKCGITGIVICLLKRARRNTANVRQLHSIPNTAANSRLRRAQSIRGNAREAGITQSATQVEWLEWNGSPAREIALTIFYRYPLFRRRG